MNKWISLTFSLILSFTVFQDQKVSAVPSPQNTELELVGVYCATQFGGYWDLPQGVIACKDAKLKKYICNQGSCFVGPITSISGQTNDFWGTYQFSGCYTYYGRKYVEGVITPTTIKYNSDQSALIVRGFRIKPQGGWESVAPKDLYICPFPNGLTPENLMPSCTECVGYNWQ